MGIYFFGGLAVQRGKSPQFFFFFFLHNVKLLQEAFFFFFFSSSFSFFFSFLELREHKESKRRMVFAQN